MTELLPEQSAYGRKQGFLCHLRNITVGKSANIGDPSKISVDMISEDILK